MKNYITPEEFTRFSNIADRAVKQRNKRLMFGRYFLITAGLGLFLISLYFMLFDAQAQSKILTPLLIVSLFGLMTTCFGVLSNNE